MSPSPRSRLALPGRLPLSLTLTLALALASSALGGCAATASERPATQQAAEQPSPPKRRRFYDPWGQPQEENTPDDTIVEPEFEEPSDL
ncbi:hypothetical protein DL240_07410 [Lujinxingia litoralis]|uniref:Uncharacterized protein n=1 Tax=Lujinxingia litoralis TaxID=2211119 RepID=A0A328CAJ7_9DELT|nr:hypothetical protein [Lujinxingia litoralis]RAL23968.1 hypothetical protein DL240_07410 [Lujinxingia litoralis]